MQSHWRRKEVSPSHAQTKTTTKVEQEFNEKIIIFVEAIAFNFIALLFTYLYTVQCTLYNKQKEAQTKEDVNQYVGTMYDIGWLDKIVFSIAKNSKDKTPMVEKSELT